MRAFNAAASYAAQVGFVGHVFTQQSIHVRCYRELRDRLPPSSQMAVRAIGKAVETFRRDKKVCPAFRYGHAAMAAVTVSLCGLERACARVAFDAARPSDRRHGLRRVPSRVLATAQGASGPCLANMAPSTLMRRLMSRKPRRFNQRAFSVSTWVSSTLPQILMVLYTWDAIEAVRPSAPRLLDVPTNRRIPRAPSGA